MSGNIIIGKHTLESLTSGMYSDPYVVFREYIQNSVDSIDAAISNDIIKKGEDQIVVQLRPTEQEIIIKDNGTGIANSEAEKKLISIGNSQKTSDSSRGFRGIGRLAALSYCKQLIFQTSFPGESLATIISIDAHKLSGLLLDSSDTDVSVVDVLQKVYEVKTKPEKENAHYFIVRLIDVDENSRLNYYDEVVDYLSQNTPVPYDPSFVWGKEICSRLRKEGCEVNSYNIMIQFGTTFQAIYKPYKDKVLVDKGKNIYDGIQDIEVAKIVCPNGALSAVGWIAKTNYLGSIYDKSVKGIRLRKGNILVGDHQTLNVVFKDARFNGWSMGEIYAIDKELIPNARRDNFEKNQAYFVLFEQLSLIATKITKEIRSASLKRNSELSDAMEKMDKAAKLASDALENGVLPVQKGTITQKLKSAHTAVSNTTTKDTVDEHFQEIAFEELDMLIGKFQGVTSYKALNTMDKISNTEKKILERVFKVIEGMEIDNANAIIDEIINDFSANIGCRSPLLEIHSLTEK